MLKHLSPYIYKCNAGVQLFAEQLATVLQTSGAELFVEVINSNYSIWLLNSFLA